MWIKKVKKINQHVIHKINILMWKTFLYTTYSSKIFEKSFNKFEAYFMAENGLTEGLLFIIIIKIFSTQDVICDYKYSICCTGNYVP